MTVCVGIQKQPRMIVNPSRTFIVMMYVISTMEKPAFVPLLFRLNVPYYQSDYLIAWPTWCRSCFLP